MFLVKQAQRGDADAFVALIEKYKMDLYKVAKAYLKNEEDVADVMQETTLSAWEHLGELKKAAYFKTWLTRILINNCKNGNAALPRKIFPCRAKSRRQRPMQNFMRCFPVCRRNINIYFFCIMDRDFEQERSQRFWISVRTR